MRAAGDLGARLLLDLLGRQRGLVGSIFRGRLLLALALGLGVCVVRLGGWPAEAELGGRRVQEAGLDAGEGALGKEINAVDDFVEEGLRSFVSLGGC